MDGSRHKVGPCHPSSGQKELQGMDMSSAMNIFLRQCVLRGGLPFSVELPQYKPEVIEAMEEAKRISKNPGTKRYNNFSEALEDIN